LTCGYRDSKGSAVIIIKKEAFKLRRLLKWGIAMLKVVNDLIIDVHMPI